MQERCSTYHDEVPDDLDVSTDREDLLALLAPVARLLRRVEDDAAAPAGLSMWQYAILAVAVATPGMNQRQVAERLDYSTNRIIADLDELERGGLVRRRPGPDRRSNLLDVTPAGERVVREVRARIREGEERLLEHLSPVERATWLAAARQLAEAARRDRATRNRVSGEV